MKRGKKKEVKKIVPNESTPIEVKVVSEKDQLLDRKYELVSHLTFLDNNKFQDTGEVRRALAAVELRLTQF